MKIIIRRYNIFMAEETIEEIKRSAPKTAKKRRFPEFVLDESDSESEGESDGDEQPQANVPAVVPAAMPVPEAVSTSTVVPAEEFVLLDLFYSLFSTVAPPTAPPTAMPTALQSTLPTYQQKPQILVKYLSATGYPMCGICKVAFASESEVRYHLRNGCVPVSEQKAAEFCTKFGVLVRSTLANEHLDVYKKDCLESNRKRQT